MSRSRRNRPPIKAACGEDPSGRAFRESILGKYGKDDPKLFFRTCDYECLPELGSIRFRAPRDRLNQYAILHRTPKRSNLEAGLTWQVTRYEDDEPIGDRPYRSCELALREEAKFGLSILDWTTRKAR